MVDAASERSIGAPPPTARARSRRVSSRFEPSWLTGDADRAGSRGAPPRGSWARGTGPPQVLWRTDREIRQATDSCPPRSASGPKIDAAANALRGGCGNLPRCGTRTLTSRHPSPSGGRGTGSRSGCARRATPQILGERTSNPAVSAIRPRVVPAPAPVLTAASGIDGAGTRELHPVGRRARVRFRNKTLDGRLAASTQDLERNQDFARLWAIHTRCRGERIPNRARSAIRSLFVRDSFRLPHAAGRGSKNAGIPLWSVLRTIAPARPDGPGGAGPRGSAPSSAGRFETRAE